MSHSVVDTEKEHILTLLCCKTITTCFQVCLLFTDGRASDEEKVPAASQAWADDGVTVYAIGIGSRIDQQALIDIAGSEERALRAKNFDAIAALATSLMQKVCTVGKCTSLTSTLVSIFFFVNCRTCSWLWGPPSRCQTKDLGRVPSHSSDVTLSPKLWHHFFVIQITD